MHVYCYFIIPLIIYIVLMLACVIGAYKVSILRFIESNKLVYHIFNNLYRYPLLMKKQVHYYLLYFWTLGIVINTAVATIVVLGWYATILWIGVPIASNMWYSIIIAIFWILSLGLLWLLWIPYKRQLQALILYSNNDATTTISALINQFGETPYYQFQIIERSDANLDNEAFTKRNCHFQKHLLDKMATLNPNGAEYLYLVWKLFTQYLYQYAKLTNNLYYEITTNRKPYIVKINGDIDNNAIKFCEILTGNFFAQLRTHSSQNNHK